MLGLARPPAVDALLYGCSAAFAVHVLGVSPLLRNRTWAELAWPAYTVGVVAALALAVAARRLGRRRLTRARTALAVAVLAGAILVPLGVEVARRAQPEPLHPYAASEVVVTEGAARAVTHGRNPYSVRFASPELDGRAPSTAQHFPYLPAMAAFGLPRALVPGTEWTDARLFFLAAALLLGALAVRNLRALQVLLVLPTGAAALVTGGDDVPVLALCLCALVLFDRGSESGALAAAGGAAVLKLTAWPLLVALAVASPRRGRIALAAVALVVVATAGAAPADFAGDVVLFPVGLTSLPSPAASTTLGSMMIAPVTGSLGTFHVAATLALLAAAFAAAAVVLCALARLRRRRALTASDVAAAAAFMLIALIALAPVARSGYLVYPIDLLAWAALFRRTSQSATLHVHTSEAVAW